MAIDSTQSEKMQIAAFVAAGIIIVLVCAFFGASSAWADDSAGENAEGVSMAPMISGGAIALSSELPIGLQSGARQAVQVSTGYASTAALLSDGSLWMWGSCFNKGMENLGCQAVPAKVMTDVTSICDAGDTVYALKEDRTLWKVTIGPALAFGKYEKCVIGEPELVLDDVVQFSCGDWARGAVKSDGTLWTWGANYNGMLGWDVGEDQVGMFEGDAIPRKVLSGVNSVSMGSKQATAVALDGSLWVLGYRTVSYSDDGELVSRYSPKRVLDGVSAAVPLDRAHLSGSDYGYAVLAKSGSLSIYNAALGHTAGDVESASGDKSTNLGSLQSVEVAQGVRSLLVPSNYDFAFITESGSLCSMKTGYGVPEPSSDVVMKVAEDVSAAQIGVRHSGMVKTDGSLWMWGDNTWGELGDGTTESRDEPMQIFANGEWTVQGVSDELWSSPFDLSRAQVAVEAVTGTRGQSIETVSRTYTGKAIVFDSIFVRVNGEYLVPGVEYDVQYTDNVNVGKGKVIITGKQDWFGTYVATFNIVADSKSSSAAENSGNTPSGSSHTGSASSGFAAPGSAGSVSESSSSADNANLKLQNPVKVKASSKTVKAKKLKRKAQSVKPLKVTDAAGKVTFKNVSAKKALKRFKVAAKTGKVTVPKNTKKGTYKVKVRVSAAGDATHLPATKTVTVKIKVK